MNKSGVKEEIVNVNSILNMLGDFHLASSRFDIIAASSIDESFSTTSITHEAFKEKKKQ